MATSPDTAGSDVDLILGRTVLGNYVVENRLGSGAMGAVYRARHNRLPDTWVALKVLTMEDSDQSQARFEQEAMVAAAVGTQRVARPIDLGRFDDGIAYIVMEYVQGRSLDEALRETGPFELVAALIIATRIADTLVIAHEKGIVHRDIKPANIMLTPDANNELTVKVLDFGVARASGELKLAHTGRSLLVGSPGYMSPEAIVGAGADGRADVFAIGVVLFEMLTGELPFDGNSIEELVASVLCDPTPSAAERRPIHMSRVPIGVDELVMRALAKKREDRIGMPELYGQLLLVLDELSGTTTGPMRRTTGPIRIVNPDVSMRAWSATSRVGKEAIDPAAATLAAASGSGLAARVDGALRAAGIDVAEWQTEAAPPETAAPPVETPIELEREPEPAVSASLKPSRRRTGALVAFFSLAFLLIGGGVVLLRSRSGPENASRLPPPPTEARPATATAVPPELAPRTAATPAAVAPSTITMTIDSTPPGALVYRAGDGVLLGQTPFRQQVPPSQQNAAFLLKRSLFKDARVELPASHSSSVWTKLLPADGSGKRHIEPHVTLDPFARQR